MNHPATHIVHWPTGPTPCCERHARELRALGNFLGAHIAVTEPTEPAECSNCENEAGQQQEGQG